MDSRDFLREARIMKELRHPNLIQLYAVGIISKYEFFENFAQRILERDTFKRILIQTSRSNL